MFQPPLQLERSFFTKLQVEADPRHRAEASKADLRAEPIIGALDDERRRWQVELDIAVGPEVDALPPPYRLHLHLIGIFTFFQKGRTEEEEAGILRVTGVSILYSQARELLLMLTSRGAWGPFQLPTVSFVDTELQRHGPEETQALREPAATYRAGARRKVSRPAEGAREAAGARRRVRTRADKA